LPDIRYDAPMRLFFRKLHRWLGLLMALQIVAWMGSGLYFSLIPITEIRGEHLTQPEPHPDRQQLGELVHPRELEDRLTQHFGEAWALRKLELVSREGEVLWRAEVEFDDVVHARLLSANGNRVEPPLSAEQARMRAEKWLSTPSNAQSVEWIESLSQSPEIRGRELPVWKVQFAEPNPVNIYLHPWTGELLARRTQQWRIFDFLWMLHIMDFDTRDNFNHPLLQVSAALGLVVALGGIVLWAMTTRLFRRGRKRASPAIG
jgi:uncharacterized iron-regulated membrane protein